MAPVGAPQRDSRQHLDPALRSGGNANHLKEIITRVSLTSAATVRSIRLVGWAEAYSWNPMDRLESILSSSAFCALGILAMWYFGPSLVTSDLQSIVPWSFLVILLAVFVWAEFRFRNPCAEAEKRLRQAANGLARRPRNEDESRGDPNPEPDDPLRCPVSFARDRRFSFSNLWTQFSNAWKGPTGHPGSTERPLGTAPAEDFFTTESILGKRWDTIPDALPGVFTAVGLLGTFVGIAIGLADIPQGTSGGLPSTENLMQSIDTLIGGMSTAFSTSIVGITASIWWIFAFRGARKKLESSLSDFIRQTDQLFPVEQPHETLMRIATTNAEAAKGVGALDGFASLREDVASVKGGIQTLGQDIHDALEPLVVEHIKEPIQNLNVDLGERQTEALGQMVTEFRDTLVSHVGDELHRFGEALKSARAHQSSTVAELEAFFTLLEEVSNTQLQVLDRGSRVAATFDRGLSAMTKSQEAIEGAGSAARQIMEEAQALVEESRQQMASQKEAADALRESWDAERDTLSDLKEHFLALTSELGDKILEFRGLAAEKIADVFHSFDSEMGKVTEHLGGTLAELRETTEEFPGIALRLVDVTSNLEKASKEQHESLTLGFERFEQVTGRIAEHLDLGREELTRANERLPALAQEINQGIGRFVESIQGIGTSFNGAADTTVRATAEAGGLLDQTVTELRSANSQFPEFVQRVAESSDRTVQGIDQLSAAAAAIAAVRETLEMLDSTMSNLPRELSEEIRRQQASAITPPARIDGVSKQRNVDGERIPTPGLPRPVVPREATGAPGHSEPPAAGQQRETPQSQDARKPVQRHTDGDLQPRRVRAEPSAIGGDRVARSPAGDDPRDEPNQAKRRGWLQRLFGRGQ